MNYRHGSLIAAVMFFSWVGAIAIANWLAHLLQIAGG